MVRCKQDKPTRAGIPLGLGVCINKRRKGPFPPYLGAGFPLFEIRDLFHTKKTIDVLSSSMALGNKSHAENICLSEIHTYLALWGRHRVYFLHQQNLELIFFLGNTHHDIKEDSLL